MGNAHQDTNPGRREWIKRHAVFVRAFEPAAFDVGGDEEDSTLAAGALIVAATQMIDELFQDIKSLAEKAGDTVADNRGTYLVLKDLPQRFAHHYNDRFARRFHVAAVMITGRLSAEQWMTPSSVGEALALHLVIQRAQDLLVDHEIVDQEQARHMYLELHDAAFDDLDHEWLYRADLDGFEDDGRFSAMVGSTDMRLTSWFEQIADAPGYAHPFSIDVEAPVTN
jgi:hypothetical protein